MEKIVNTHIQQINKLFVYIYIYIYIAFKIELTTMMSLVFFWTYLSFLFSYIYPFIHLFHLLPFYSLL